LTEPDPTALVRRLEEAVRDRTAEVARLEQRVDELLLDLEHRDQMLGEVLSSRGWRLLNRFRDAREGARRALARLRGVRLPRTRGTPSEYEAWLGQCRSFLPPPAHATEMAARFAHRPLVSVVMAVSGGRRALLARALASVQGQLYPDWELVVASAPGLRRGHRRLLEAAARDDSRVRLLHGAATPPGALRAAAVGAARGDYVAFLGAEDVLALEALFEAVAALQEEPADLVYTDEDRIDASGRHHAPVLKPDWSPELLLSWTRYPGRLALFRARLLRAAEAGPWRTVEAADYARALAAGECEPRVTHVARVLYHRGARGGRRAGGECRRALEEAVARRGIAGRVEATAAPGILRVRRALAARPLVSILIPTRDKGGLLARCLRSLEASTYPSREVVLIDHETTEAAARRVLDGCGHRVLPFAGAFNFSAMVNRGAAAARGEYLVLLNNDTEVRTPHWLEALLEQGERPGVGAVGARLLYPDGRIQHAGILVGLNGVAGTAHRTLRGSGHLGLAEAIQECSAVTAACMLVRRSVFEAAGGFEEGLAVAYNDVDFCLRLRAAGHRVLYTPCATLVHHESATRPPRDDPRERRFMRERWGGALERDPFYNANFSPTTEGFRLGPPRGAWTARDTTQPDASAAVGELTARRSAGQTFVCRAGGLTAISVVFGTYRRANAGRLVFTLRAGGPGGEELVRQPFEAARLRDNEPHTFWFAPLPDSAGRRYHFSVASLDGRPGNAVTVWCGSAARWVGQRYADGQEARGALAFTSWVSRWEREGSAEPAVPASAGTPAGPPLPPRPTRADAR
jgi:GT2 family glycosyltransferase